MIRCNYKEYLYSTFKMLVRKVLLASILASSSFVNPAFSDERVSPFPEGIQIADSSMSQSQILKRLNALEAEVKSLRKQLRNTSISNTATPNTLGNKDKGLYFTAGAGFLGLDEITNDGTQDSWAPTPMEGGLSAEVGLGYRFNKNARGEMTYGVNNFNNAKIGESGYLNNDRFETSSVFVSGYYDFANQSKLTPYLGLGIGSTFIDSDDNTNTTADDSTLTFGYQGKLGVSYEIGELTDVFVEGVLQKTKLFSMTNDIYNPLTMYSGRLGLRYKF